MADVQKDADQSMEDILQSIKRIIADEGDVPAPASPTTLDADVLELTELLAEDVAVPDAVGTAAPGTLSLDEIMAMPEPAAVPVTPPSPPPAPVVVAAPPPAPEPEPEPVVPEPVVAPAVTPPPPPVSAPVAPPAAPKPVAAPAVASPSGGLISESTLAASMAALNALLPSQHPQHTSPSPVFRSGATVEDLALEAIRPMVKEWLDTNLPGMVRQMVEREIRRIRGDA